MAGKLLDMVSDAGVQVLVGTAFNCAIEWAFSGGPSVQDELRELQRREDRIHARLAGADRLWRVDDAAARLWLDELRSVAFDIDDLMDEYQTRLKIGGPRNYVTGLPARIKQINKRFDRISKDRRYTSMAVSDGTRTPTFREHGQLETGSLQGPFEIHGRHQERTNLVEFLNKPSCGPNNMSVISIVGPGGIGKTMLAQAVFNDAGVGGWFPLRIWICVRQGFDATRTTSQIVKAITNQDPNLSTLDKQDYNILNLELLQRQLQQLLSKKKFLLVLDGMYTEDPYYWDKLQVPLLSGEAGSKVLVTTRSKEVSRKMNALDSLELKKLDDDSCWFVFRDNAFSQPVGSEPENLAVIGKEIARKCSGSPLAARLLGKTLRNVAYEQEWRSLLNQMPNPTDIVENILPVLRISYDLLPLHLKRCFAYCSIFPKDYEFDNDDLVKLWIAEGLVKADRPRENQTLEDVGCKYFNNLLGRSFFQSCDTSQMDKQKYIMPSAINDLAESVSAYECLRVGKLGVMHGNGDTRYALLCHKDWPPADAWSSIYERKYLRTLIMYSGGGAPMNFIPSRMAENLPYLRVLDLSDSQIKELPATVGDLIHLRYINLRRSLVESLPESFCNLYNLQTLGLAECYKLKELPKGMRRLVNIKHIDLHVDWETWDRSDLDSMPPGMGGLTALQTLSRFSVASGEGFGIAELRDLDLHGELCISNLENVSSVDNAEEANLSKKQHLEFVMLRWSDCSPDSRKDEEVLKHLCPPKMIKQLWIECYNGVRFPDWMETTSFPCLQTLKLYRCRNTMNLPRVGSLPLLKQLHIEGSQKVKSLSFLLSIDGGATEFPSLEVLHLIDMPDLEMWFGSMDDVLTRLSELVISNCPKLRNLSHIPGRLQKLELRNCPGVMGCPDAPYLHSLVVKKTDQEIANWIPLLTSLSSLSISEIAGLQHLGNSFFCHLTGVKRLMIEGCSDLVSVARNGLTDLSFEYMEISSCPKLKWFADKGLPSTMKELKLKYLDTLASLPQGLDLLNNLQKMEIVGAPQIASIPRLPFQLLLLSISGCPVLQERCQIDGADWSNIQHVQNKRIGDVSEDQLN